MKRILILILLILFFVSCQTISFNWPKTAYEEGWVRPEEIPSKIEKEQKGPPLPKPKVPILETENEDGSVKQFTAPELMELTIKYGRTIDKFKYLVEIYERQYTTRKLEEAYHPEKSLEELKIEYFRLLGIKPKEESDE